MSVLLFQTIAPGISLPPQPALTRWKTWLDAVNYYAKYYCKIMEKRKTNSLVLEFGNKVYAKSDFEVAPEYKQILIRDFLSDVETADFLHPVQSASQINSWVANITHNRIPTILKPSDISERTQMVLVNGIFLKGVWLTPFREENTSEKTFSPNPGVEIKVPMMHQTGKFRAGDDPNLGAKWVELPFDTDDGDIPSSRLKWREDAYGLCSMAFRIASTFSADTCDRSVRGSFATDPVRMNLFTRIWMLPRVGAGLINILWNMFLTSSYDRPLKRTAH
ncbi:hypothetical protein ANN_03291 [Periplaneta americana]|uniref:Serpin domain-containing protein n=1 Tax=Periplaneta americana TaxID=6978 RepID=A0ABQ8U227_PERAM|nr:hypothetical protein ANN_03291 [Periplaneta americana]